MRAESPALRVDFIQLTGKKDAILKQAVDGWSDRLLVVEEAEVRIAAWRAAGGLAQFEVNPRRTHISSQAWIARACSPHIIPNDKEHIGGLL